MPKCGNVSVCSCLICTCICHIVTSKLALDARENYVDTLNSSQDFTWPLRLLCMFLVFYAFRDLIAYGVMYDEANSVLGIPHDEIYKFSKHPREAFFLRLFAVMMVLDAAMLMAVFRRSTVFLWVFPFYFSCALFAPIANLVWFQNLYGHALTEAARSDIFIKTMANLLATFLLVFPWLIYVFASSRIRAFFSLSRVEA